MTTQYETVIGLEVHSQLLTNSKMFCSCGSDYQNAQPNTRVCPICMGMPGVLPVVNKKAVELVILTGLALGCGISETTKFDRKNYPYPDLMKGYQISQFDQPIAGKGVLSVQDAEGKSKDIGVTRVHLEEDVAKLLHRQESHGEGYSLLDINRAGVPLMEIVSEPDMRSPEEAHNYLTSLHSIVRQIGASTANMEAGSFRCDANISIRPFGTSILGEKVEIKNVNSFRSVFRALKYEEERQREAIENGEPIIQETRGWSDERGTTISQRTKEYASDYRYFPEPDLPPIKISRDWVHEVKSRLPELPAARKERYLKDLQLSEYDADILSTNLEFSILFDKTITQFPNNDREQLSARSKSVCNWITVELARLINEINEQPANLTPNSLAELVLMVESGRLSNSMAKTVFDKAAIEGGTPKDISDALGMSQISDSSLIEKTVATVILENPEAVSDYLEGKTSVVRFMVGQIMKKTQGKANPKMATEVLEAALNDLR